MPRKGHVKKRITPPDSIYGSASVTKFINCLMMGGKKSTAERWNWPEAGSTWSPARFLKKL